MVLKNMRETFFCLLFAALAAISAPAQEYSRYAEEAGGELPIYRGRCMVDYRMRYNGTPYWDNLGFETGSLCYSGKVYEGVSLNVDAAQQALYIRRGNYSQVWDLGRESAEWFTFRGHKFVNLRDFGTPEAPEGFLEVLFDGDEKVYRQVRKAYREDIDRDRSGRIGYEDPDFDYGILGYFEFSESFWFQGADGRLKKYRSLKALLKKHPVF